MAIVHVTKDTFEQEVLTADKPVIVDFWAVWCGPCQALAPVLEEIDKENGDQVKVCKINVDEEGELAVQFGIMSIPTVLIFKDGEQVGKSIGFTTKEAILELVP